MIKKIKLKNFRNFEDKEFFFSEDKNLIIGENGKGKTNLLEAVSLLSDKSILNINFENLVKKGKDFFYLEYTNKNDDLYSIFYELKTNKKRHLLNGKAVVKKKFSENNEKTVNFSPIVMNMICLSPNLRREFLDETIASSYTEYRSIIKKYKEVLVNRNKVLKNIKEKKSEKKEIFFWDKKFIEISSIVYKFRFELNYFLKENIKNLIEVFNNKIKNIDFVYKTKLDEHNLEEKIKDYLEKNLDRDIILGKTNIGPHIDDFLIILDEIPIINFASRGEIKSIIIGLKLLEIHFIEKITKKKPILLIDDLFSELDLEHKNMVLRKISGYQTFITSIENKEISSSFGKIISL